MRRVGLRTTLGVTQTLGLVVWLAMGPERNGGLVGLVLVQVVVLFAGIIGWAEQK